MLQGAPEVQVERLGVITHHVHLRARKAFVRDVVQTREQDNEIATAACSQSQRMFGGLRICGCDLMAVTADVIVICRPCAAIAQSEVMA